MLYFKKKEREDVNFTYNNERLKIVDDFQYLGIIFSRKGTFNNKIKLSWYNSQGKLYFYVLRKARKLCLPLDVLLQLFDAMVAPILLYGSEVWGYEDCNVIKTLHLEFCKYVMS